MADEARISSGMTIRVSPLDYNSRPASFTADVSAASAPAPGKVTAALTPTLVDLSARGVVGLCRIQNMDATNYVEVGMYNSDDNEFLPMLEIYAGESWVMRLSRLMGKEVVGTGTTGSTTSLALRANTAAVQCLVEVFEK